MLSMSLSIRRDVDESMLCCAAQRLTAEEEAERLQRTVFVGNLPALMKRKAVQRLFAECVCSDAVCRTRCHLQHVSKASTR